MFFRLVSVRSYCLHTFLLSVYRKYFTFLSFFLIFLYFYKLLARLCTVIFSEAGSTQTSNKREFQKVADSISYRISSIFSLGKNVNVSNLFITCIINSHVRCIVIYIYYIDCLLYLLIDISNDICIFLWYFYFALTYRMYQKGLAREIWNDFFFII